MSYKVTYLALYEGGYIHGTADISAPSEDRDAFRFVLAQLFNSNPKALKRLRIIRVCAS